MTPKRPDLFHGMGRPSVRPGLKQQVLARARSAAGVRPALADRLWESRPLRLAWTVAVVALLGVQLALAGSMDPSVASTEPPATHRAGVLPPARTIAGTDPDLVPFLDRHPTRRGWDARPPVDLRPFGPLANDSPFS